MGSPPDLRGLLAVARGEAPADVVLRDAQLVNVASGEVYPADIAIAGCRVAGIGRGYRGRDELELHGAFVAPGFIDAHVHMESAMVAPSELARLLLPGGVTAVVSDPHEIANVAGLPGVRFMLRDARRSALATYVNAPSCVPASELATTGARLDAEDLEALLSEPEVLGLAEVMSYPSVVAGADAVLAKLHAFAGRPADGHCPGLTGHALNAYAAAGITSDHECTTLEEAREKLRLGMTVFIREASNAKNLRALLPLARQGVRKLCLCTDDRHALDLRDEGSIDHLVRMAIAGGVEPVKAIAMATLNVAEHFGLRDRGLVAPGRVADLVVFRDLTAPRAELVYAAGRVVAREGELLAGREPCAPAFTDSVRIDWRKVGLAIPAAGRELRVIGVIPDQIVTRHLRLEAKVVDGHAVADPARDLSKMAVIERYRESGRVGLGFVSGLGLQHGAIATTVAHDHHNLVVIGVDDRSMLTAARAVADAGGGLAVAEDGAVRALLPLPIAGLMSERPFRERSSHTTTSTLSPRTASTSAWKPGRASELPLNGGLAQAASVLATMATLGARASVVATAAGDDQRPLANQLLAPGGVAHVVEQPLPEGASKRAHHDRRAPVQAHRPDARRGRHPRDASQARRAGGPC